MLMEGGVKHQTGLCICSLQPPPTSLSGWRLWLQPGSLVTAPGKGHVMRTWLSWDCWHGVPRQSNGIVQGNLRKSNIRRQCTWATHPTAREHFFPTNQPVYLLPQGHSEDFCAYSFSNAASQRARKGKVGVPGGLLKAWVPCLLSHLVPFPFERNIFAFHFLQTEI